MSLRVSANVQRLPRCLLLSIVATIQYLVIQYYLKDPSASTASMPIRRTIVISNLVLANEDEVNRRLAIAYRTT